MIVEVTEETIERAGRLLAEAAPSPAKIILFGSHARGDAGPGSDLDFLVVEREVTDRFGEMVRLRRALNELLVPADVIVVDERRVEEWGDVKGTMLHTALREGRVIAES